MTIIFIGDKPSPKMKPGARPFEGATCEKRLSHWINVVMSGRNYKGYSVVNAYKDKIQHTLAFLELVNVETGFLASVNIKKPLKFIALGNNASKALKGIPHFKLPHPSGRNRLLNNKTYVDEQLRLCKAWLQEGL